jgi:hypothetical protein
VRLLLYARGRVSLFSIEGMQTPSLYRIESVSTRYREGTARQAWPKVRQRGGKWHGKPRQSKASLAMSCLALPGESLLSIERIRRLISSIERRREGTA